jgi:hypothetical protein
MKNILDYQLVTASQPQELQNRVREAMNKGWTIWGGVQCFPSETLIRGTLFLQAMVKFGAES